MNLATATNVVFHYFLYFSSPFANFSKGLEIRLSLSPATLFSDVSLPNHTKMFELVHMVTSMEDFALRPHCDIYIELAKPKLATRCSAKRARTDYLLIGGFLAQSTYI